MPKGIKVKNHTMKLSAPEAAVMPEAWQKNRRKREISKTSQQGKLTLAVLAMEVGQVIKVTHDGDRGGISARLTLFKKRFPDIKLTTRTLDDFTIGIYRLS